MSAYNGARYLRQSIDSLLAQSFGDLELIIVDDGSTDGTAGILDSYRDPRIVQIRNETNIGLTRSLNRGLAIARGQYVARQDADDLSLPYRLASQVQFLDSHPDVCLVGTGFVQIDEQGQELGVVTMPTEPEQIREMLFYAHCFCHGSVMGRRADLQAAGGYDEQFVAAQDTELWLRMAERCQLANLPAPLYGLRMHAASVTGRSRSFQKKMEQKAMAQAMARCLSQPDSCRPSSLTLGRFYFGQAMQALEEGCGDCARQQLVQAREENRRLDNDADYLTHMAVRRAFELGPAGTSHLKSPNDVRVGLRFVHDLFDLLPQELELLRAKRRRVMAELHAAYAFAAFETASRIGTVQHCLSTWCYEPSRLRQRGLLSVFARSLVGFRPGRSSERSHG